MESREENPTIPGLDPEPDDPETRLAYQAEQRRFVKAFSEGATTQRGTHPLSVRPMLLIGAVVTVLIVGFAAGAVPRLIHQSSSSANTAAQGTRSPQASTSPGASTRARTSPGAHPTASMTAGGTGHSVGVAPAVATPGAGLSPAPSRGGAKTTPATSPAKHRTSPTPRPSPTPTSSVTATATATGPAPFTAVVGYGCPQTADASFADYGWFSDGDLGFYYASTGGFTGGGCDGSYVAMPMSGSATEDDSGNYATWAFLLDPKTSAKSLSCQIDVYIPNDGNVEDVGGDPAYYTVYQDDDNSVTELGAFKIDQVSNLGQWVNPRTYTVIDGSVLTVRVHSRGLDWNATTGSADYAHIAVGPAGVVCTS